jgi:hypothetical protein
VPTDLHVWRRRLELISGLLAMAYGVSSLPDPPVPYAGPVALYSAAAHVGGTPRAGPPPGGRWAVTAVLPLDRVPAP